jgi:hypothetical protein
MYAWDMRVIYWSHVKSNDGEHCTAGCEELGLVQSTECPSVFRKRHHHTICTPSSKLPFSKINGRIQCDPVVNQEHLQAPTPVCTASNHVRTCEVGSQNSVGASMVKPTDLAVSQGISNSGDTHKGVNGGVENSSDAHLTDASTQMASDSGAAREGESKESAPQQQQTAGAKETLRCYHTAATTCPPAREPASRVAHQARPQSGAWARTDNLETPKRSLQYCRLAREGAPKQPLLAVRPSTCHGTRASTAYACRRTDTPTTEYGHSGRGSDRLDFDSLDDYLQSIGRYAIKTRKNEE